MKHKLVDRCTKRRIFDCTVPEGLIKPEDIKGYVIQKAVRAEVNLYQADLTNANLQGADLAGAQFRKADLSGSNLTNASLIGADMGGAFLENTKLEGALTDGCCMDKVMYTSGRVR